jgi:hypothetical protein
MLSPLPLCGNLVSVECVGWYSVKAKMTWIYLDSVAKIDYFIVLRDGFKFSNLEHEATRFPERQSIGL